MLLSVALISIGFLLIWIPQLNQGVTVWVQNIPYVNRIRMPAATLFFIVGMLGLMMNWF